MTEKEKQALLKQKMSRPAMILSIVGTALVLLAIVGVLFWRLYQVQVVDGAMYATLASEQQLIDTTIEAERGEIYDATGKLLATNNILWDMSCDPKSSTGLLKTITTTDATTGEEVSESVLNTAICSELSDIIARILLAGDGSSGADIDATSEEYIAKYETVYAAYSSVDSYYKVLEKEVLLPVSEALEEAVDAFNTKYEISIIITSAQNSKRSYPYGTLASTVLGFCNDAGEGIYGLENSYDDVLSGTDGRLISVQNVYGSEVATTSSQTYAAQDGYDLTLTLDVYVQSIVEYYLDEAVAANDVENRGTCVVMDVNTGGIIAMATNADYDPNDPYTVDDYDYVSAMITDEPELYAQYKVNEAGQYDLDSLGNKIVDDSVSYTATYREIQWKNKSITELYYPGSVFKLFTAAAALDAGIANVNTCYECTGSYTVAGTTYHCAGLVSHGVLNMSDAVRNSCNIYFIQLAEALGADTFFDYYNAFGFTETTGVDLPYETTFMQYYDADSLGPVELASSSFGQAQVVTALQTCTAIAACVNGGYLIVPHVVSEVTDANGNVIESVSTQIKRQVVSESVSEVMQYLMEYEVGYGTTIAGGYRSYVAGYRIGGKTGTSEQLNMDLRDSDGDYKKVVSYVAVLPADDPEIVVFLMLDDPNNPSTDYASALAAPVVGNIISEIAPYLGISTTGEDLSETLVTVPNLVGLTWSAGQVELNRIGLQHELEASADADITGALITYQYPAAGTEVAGGTTIYTYVEGTTGTMTTVPSVVGKTSTFAQQMIAAAGLNCDIIGDEDGIVTAQSITAEESVEYGTIITIVCESE